MFQLPSIIGLLLLIRFSSTVGTVLDNQTEKDLYNEYDDVFILTQQNFDQLVYGQNNAWVVEFYANWCGFCQRFAPKWKSLATRIKAWQGVINVGVVRCDDEINGYLCRNIGITRYPRVRYFNANNKNSGENIEFYPDEENAESLEELFLRKMIEEREKNQVADVPPLLPYKYPDLSQLSNVNHKYVFLIIDKFGSLLGPQLALDFHKYNQIGVRYVNPMNSELIRKLNPKSIPFMMVMTAENEAHVFPEGLQTREMLREAIIEYVKPDVVIVTEKKVRPSTVAVPEISSIVEDQVRRDLLAKVKKLGDVNFQADLESALRYSLKREIGDSRDISGDKQKALYDYVTVLLRYFPFGSNGKTFLTEVLNAVQGQWRIDGADIANIVSKYEDEQMNVFSSPYEWVGCLGSTKVKRGYTCGLWKLFHYLTVQASNNTENPKEVLKAMHGYVKHFFSCEDCSRHFRQMALDNEMESVASPDEAVLWLWNAHNHVNKRLAGDVSEDPDFPKVQFPTIQNCPICLKGYSWDYIKVLDYLKHVYDVTNINYIWTNLHF